MKDKTKELREIIFKLSKYDFTLKYEDIFKELTNVYKDGYRHEYSILFLILIEIDKIEVDFSIDNLSENIKNIYDKSEKDESVDMNIKKCIHKLYDHISLEIQRIGYMKVIDEKTERNKSDLLLSLNQKEKKLKDSISKYAKKVEDIDKETMKKMGMYISIFTLIAGNIAVLFKGIEVSPIELAGLIFIINSILIISIRTLFYFVDKDKKVSEDTVIGCMLGIGLGVSCFLISATQNNNYFKRSIENNIKNEYKYRFENYDRKLLEYKQENYILRLENENLKSRVDEIEKENLKNKK